MSSTGEIELVADIQTQANGTDMALEASAWIEHAFHVAALQVIDAAEEVSDGCGVIAHAEMDEAPF